jgi:hypothetical protein
MQKGETSDMVYFVAKANTGSCILVTPVMIKLFQK